MRDDDALDLSAWEPPPPPDVTDAVIARLGGTAVGAAVPVEPPPRRRWLVAGASAAAALVVAAGAWVIVRGREHAAPPRGEVVAERARHVELGAASADLDPGAEVRWRTTAGGLHVEQQAGTATWRVGEHHVEIDAMVASTKVSIDAVGASLRVEVPMNLSDPRVIGASTVAAAAVALVTVVVYDGHVKVHHGDQTVTVQPGATFTVPAPPPEPPVVGVAPSARPIVAVLGYHVTGTGDDGAIATRLTDALRARVKAGGGPWLLAAGADPQLVDLELLHGCTDEAPACMAQIGSELGADVVVYGRIGQHATGAVVQTRRLDVAHATIERTVAELIPPAEQTGAALAGHAKAIYAKLAGPATACDASALVTEGGEQMARGAYGGALAAFEQALACEPTGTRAVKLAYLASCKLRDPARARRYWSQLAPDEQTALLPMCVQQGISRAALAGEVKRGCDAEDLITKGEGADTRGAYGEALARFEQALACDPSQADRIDKLAVMEACKAKDVAKARAHLAKVDESMRATMMELCARQGVALAACDAGELEAKGTSAAGAGQYALALAAFERALACKPGDARLVKLAFMSACGGANLAKARRYYGELEPAQRQALAQLCTRRGITPDQLEATGAGR